MEPLSQSGRQVRGTPPAEYRGHCRRCARAHRFVNDVALASQALERLFAGLEHEPAVHAALQVSRGKMLGVLVAEAADGERHLLRAYSGELAGRRDWPEWVPPVLRRADTAALEAVTLARIAALDREIAACDVERAQQCLDEARRLQQQEAAERREQRAQRRPREAEAEKQQRAEAVARIEVAREALLAERARLHALRVARREASQALSTAMFDAAGVTNARGERWPLREIFVGEGIVGGTTDCTVPKLLEAANVARLRPVALAEAWWGPTINGRLHGDVQLPCERKCQPILGHLLCGLEES